jgi:hypothetical protein
MCTMKTLHRLENAMFPAKHSVMHQLKVSDCTTKWEELSGKDDVTRKCPKCQSQILNIKGLSEDDVETAIRSLTLNSNMTEKVLLRTDGTLVLENRPCDYQDKCTLLVATLFWFGSGILTCGVACLAAFGWGLIGILLGLLTSNRKAARTALTSLVLPSALALFMILAIGGLFVLIAHPI